MNTAEWILVVILSCTLFIFLIIGIILMIRIINITDEAKKVVIKSQDIADNTNGIITNIKGMTSIGGLFQAFADRYINKIKLANEKDAEAEKVKEAKTTSTKTR